MLYRIKKTSSGAYYAQRKYLFIFWGTLYRQVWDERGMTYYDECIESENIEDIDKAILDDFNSRQKDEIVCTRDMY